MYVRKKTLKKPSYPRPRLVVVLRLLFPLHMIFIIMAISTFRNHYHSYRQKPNPLTLEFVFLSEMELSCKQPRTLHAREKYFVMSMEQYNFKRLATRARELAHFLWGSREYVNSHQPGKFHATSSVYHESIFDELGCRNLRSEVVILCACGGSL